MALKELISCVYVSAPPSYDSCVFSSENDRALGNQRVGGGRERTGFAPQYVTYRMLNSAPEQ